MKQTRKIMIAGIGICAVAGMLVSFSGRTDEGKMKRYQVIHQENGEVVEYDTVVPMTSNYSVEDFLADKGIESENVEIINVPSLAMENLFIGDEMEGEHVIIREFKHDTTIDSIDGEEVKIECIIDGDGNRVTKKFVNGEEVELTEEEMEKIIMHEELGHEGEHMIIKMEMDHDMKDGHTLDFEHDLDGEEVKIICEIDDEGNKKMKKFVNGEEVEVTEEDMEKLEMHSMGEGNHMMIKIDSEEIDINEILKEVEGELTELEIDLDELNEELEIEISQIIEEVQNTIGEDGESKVIIRHIESDGGSNEDQIIHLDGDTDFEWKSEHDAEVKIMSSGDMENFTVVLVTENYTPSNEPNVKMNIRKELSDNAVAIYPNPSMGVINIRFDQPEKVKTTVEITNIQGKKVFKENLGKFSGQYEKSVDLKEFGPGMYNVTIQQGDQVNTHKVIVE